MTSSDLIAIFAHAEVLQEDIYLLVHSASGVTDCEKFYAPNVETALKYKEDFNEKYNEEAELYVKVKE